MNKARGLSIIAITLLILQLFSANIGMVTISQAANKQVDGKVEVSNKNVSDDTLTWEIAVSATSEEEATAKTNIIFSPGQSHDAIDHQKDVSAEKTKEGYVIEAPADGATHIVELKTKVTDESQAMFTVSAEIKSEGSTYKDEAQVEIKREVKEEEAEKVEGSKSDKPESDGTPKEESDEEEKEIYKKVEENEAVENESAEDKSDDANLEDEYIPVEQYGNQSGGKAKAFSLNKFKTMQASGEGEARHKIETQTSDNICIRELDGEINFTLPAPAQKKPVDIVVVQDASGSYSGNSNQAKQSLRDIVDMLDLSQDRMMVTSYRGYNGWRSYNNINQFPNNVRSSKGINSNEQSLTLKNHTGLSNNAQSLKSGINQIAFDGATPTASGLQFAKEEYEAATVGQDLSDRETIFILITDGVANAMLDGRIHIEYNGTSGIFGTPHSWAERYQFYQRTFSEVLSVANSIKSQGYTMVSAYWENKTILRQGYPNYDSTIGPAARAMVKNAASSPDLYNDNEDLAQAMADLLDNLQTVLNEYNGFETTFDIAPGFELVEDSVYVNGSQASYTVSDNKVTITANKIRSGDSKITYKLKETSVHGDITTPVFNGEIHYDKSNGIFNGLVDIPNVQLAGNESSEDCITRIVKSVAKDGSNEFVDSIELDEMNESFTYKLEYQFGENVAGAESIQLKDQLEAVLEIVGDENDIEINSNITNLSSTTTLLANNGGFIIGIEKQNESYNYLAGKKITVIFKAKIKDGVTSDDLVDYRELGIPNKATLLINDEPEPSNEVYVNPPKFGTIKIIKVDANNEEIKLAGAKFDVKDVDGNIVDTLVTDDSGTAISKELLAGDYALVETEAPIGYEILSTDVSVTVEAGMEITKKIKNERLTGKVIINKVDEENEALEGAEFTLMGPNGFSETKTSDNSGMIVFDNLEWGTYTLTETKAPEGYRLLKKEITIEINEDQLSFEKTIENTNQGWSIPDTGGIGSLGFYGIGFMLMAGAGWFVFRRRQA